MQTVIMYANFVLSCMNPAFGTVSIFITNLTKIEISLLMAYFKNFQSEQRVRLTYKHTGCIRTAVTNFHVG